MDRRLKPKRPALAGGKRRPRIFGSLWLAGAALLLFVGALPAGAAPEPSAQRDPIRVLAHYYIWFDPTSWNRAKTDYPVLGRYSSDEKEVMRQHIEWAKEAGIDGFIVSWKSTPVLNRRLDKLVEVAEEEDFKLSIVYEGLDFERQPLPVDRIAVDMDYFARQHADSKVFDIFGKPLVIWSGTWEFSRDQVAEVTAPLRDRLLILASEKNVDGYQRLADVVDGDGYYWSSVNPETRGHQEKLDAMATAVHAQGGLWIAPAAPGFDARLLGGKTVVDRKNGETLRREMDAAIRSSPDAVGLISWNEFSEKTYIEPSENYGTRYLEVLADILGGVAPVATDFDSNEPAAISTGYGIGYSLAVLAGIAAIIVVGLVVVVRRRSRKSGAPPMPGKG
jgi:hypothetical protein